MDKNRNALLGLSLAAGMCGMVGLSFAAVPLYRLFCQATGYGGTPQIGQSIAPGTNGDVVEVRFDSNVSAALPWQFRPDQQVITVPLGEERLASYFGRNKGERTITGVATYNVTPEKAAKYFHKTACFCFDEQSLAANASMHFPLSFWVDPQIRSDPDTRDVGTITLSYTFFRSIDDAARNGALEKAGPHVGPRS